LKPITGRNLELDAVIEVLAAGQNRNPLLVGERGAGKRALVDALAQRIADGSVPPFLAEKRIMAFDFQPAGVSARDRLQFFEELNKTLSSLAESSQVILFVREFRTFIVRGSLFGTQAAAEILRPAIVQGRIQCIAACTPAEYRELAEPIRWLGDSFRAVYIRPLSEEDTLAVLKTCRPDLEKLHEVTFDEDALTLAAQAASRYLPDRALPGKAFELLDAAAARVKLVAAAPPEEIVEVQKRIKFIVHRMDSAIANHEFEKARFYSEEEKKERENLNALCEKYHIDDSGAGVVRREEVEEMIARWSEYPFQP